MNEMKQRSESGQAIVEYILILVVSVTLILSLASVIFTPFQVFLNQFLGEYVSCLLESGELPPMGTDSLKAKTSCPIPKFRGGVPVSISGGPPGPGYDGSSSSDKGSSSGSGESDKNSSNADGSDSAKNGKGSRGNPNSRGSGRIESRPTASDGAGGSSSRSREIGLPDQVGGGPGTFSGNKFANTALGLSKNKTRAIGLDGMTDDQKQKLKSKERGGQTKFSAGEGLTAKEKKTTIKPPERKVASATEEEETGFQFGNLIRILFIIAIIVIIIALIGGQIAQMMKSWES